MCCMKTFFYVLFLIALQKTIKKKAHPQVCLQLKTN
ncbi:MAG: hypothetical protein RL757_880 [Bacteroidota bacterium]